MDLPFTGETENTFALFLESVVIGKTKYYKGIPLRGSFACRVNKRICFDSKTPFYWSLWDISRLTLQEITEERAVILLLEKL